MKCVERFQIIYNKEPADVAFCPYRVYPIGAHVDHNLGKITGLAIDKGINIAYGPKQSGVARHSIFIKKLMLKELTKQYQMVAV